MTGRFDPATYPGPRATGPVLVFAGAVHRVVVDGTSPAPVRAPVAAPVLEAGSVRYCLAYGANASPPRLIDKGLDRRGALLLPATIAGWVPVWEMRRTSYGSVPLAVVPAPTAMREAWVLGAHVDDLDALDRSEGRPVAGAVTNLAPDAYVLGRVGEVAVAGRFRFADALAYVPGPATRVQVDEGGSYRTWPESDQASAGAHVDAGDPGVPAPAPPRVDGPWPATPLEDLPLFVYGTLRPGGAAWPLVADLLEPVGAATAPGRLHDSGYGWPAASFEPTSEEVVRGVLLQPRDPAAVPGLLEQVDRYEGVPGLFRRTTVLAVAAGRRRFALAYTWADGAPPGPAVIGGLW